VEISGNNQFRVFGVNAPGGVTLNGLTIRNGAAGGGNGGGIENEGGDLILDSCTLMNNTAANGGAIFSNTGGTGSTLIVRNCTLSGNSGTGAAIYMDGPASLESCTIVGNSSPVADYTGAVFHEGFSGFRPQVHNSIIAGNTGGGDVGAFYATSDYQTYQSGGYNLIGQGSAADQFNAGTDQRIGSADPGVAALAENGGRTRTRALLPNSPAVFSGDSALSVDQRGLPRPANVGDDRGAFKIGYNDPTGAAGLVVTTLQDTTSADGFISLREAIVNANSDGNASVITFDASVFGGGRQRIILNGTQLPDIAGNGALAINAPASGVEVSANNASRIFRVGSTAGATFTGLTTENSGAL
jgi:hypothetical protein